jgi:hypothetical protein
MFDRKIHSAFWRGWFLTVADKSLEKGRRMLVKSNFRFFSNHWNLSTAMLLFISLILEYADVLSNLNNDQIDKSIQLR